MEHLFWFPESGGEDGHTLGIKHICTFHDLIIQEWNADVPLEKIV
jgi:hypothetical protein